MSCGVGRRRGLDLALLWLWHRLEATAPIRPLALEPLYAVGVALKEPRQKETHQPTLFAPGACDSHQHPSGPSKVTGQATSADHWGVQSGPAWPEAGLGASRGKPIPPYPFCLNPPTRRLGEATTVLSSAQPFSGSDCRQVRERGFTWEQLN